MNQTTSSFSAVHTTLAGALLALALSAPSGALAGTQHPTLIGADPVATALHNGAWTPSHLALCFAPGTDPAYMARVNEWVRENSIPDGDDGRYFIGARWPGPAGDPVDLTYSFPSDGFGGINGGITSTNVLNARMVNWFGSVNNGRAKFAQVFFRWSQLSGAIFTEVPDDNAPWGFPGDPGSRGDIRIVSINIDGPGGVLAFNFFPPNGDMVLDSSDNYGSSSNDFRFFRNVVAHENGHGMGLAHSCPQNGTKLMEPALVLGFDGPQLDDIRGMQKNYGDRFRNNQTSANAGNLGVLSGSTVNVNNVSIDSNSFFTVDIDWYRFTMPVSGTVSVTVTPVGVSYPNGPQDGMSCTVTGTVDALSIHDLAFELYAPDATTVIASANDNPIGLPESVTDVPLNQGTHYIRVFSVSDSSDVQMYRLTIEPNLDDCPGDANGDGVVNFADLNILLIQWGQCGPILGGDVNGDGCVDFADLSIILDNFGLEC